MRARAAALWKDDGFRQRIQAARKARGYPDTNRPEAVAKRKMRVAAKNAIHKCLRMASKAKDSTTVEILGYTIAALVERIASTFQPGMTWANYGEWEVDHIKAISKFQPGTPISEINALSNLQALWKKDNRAKWNK